MRLLLLLSLFFCSCASTFHERNGLQLETPKDNSDRKQYTLDNKIYPAFKEYHFSYTFIKEGKQYYFKCSDNAMDLRNEWDYVEPSQIDSNTIVSIKMKVLEDQGRIGKRRADYDETVIEYTYLTATGQAFYKERTSFAEQTGLVENKKNIWMHPPRGYLFKILQITPWPYVKYPCKIGQTWDWTLKIGPRWGDARWKEWEENIDPLYQYEITKKEALKTEVGSFDCYVIEAKGQSKIGPMALTALYNKAHGFLKYTYQNIDQSQMTLELIGMN